MRGCDKIYTCPDCGKPFRGPGYFRHRQKAHGYVSQRIRRINAIPNSPPIEPHERTPMKRKGKKQKTGKGHLLHRYTCPGCKKVFVGNGFFSHTKRCPVLLQGKGIQLQPQEKKAHYAGLIVLVSQDPVIHALNELGFIVMSVTEKHTHLLEEWRGKAECSA